MRRLIAFARSDRGLLEFPVLAHAGQERIEDAFLGGHTCGRSHLPGRVLTRLLDRDLDQVTDDAVDIFANIAHLGELGRLHLDKRRPGQPRQAPRDLGLAHAGGADHEDVLGRDLLAQRALDLHASPAVAQRNGAGALGCILADDMLVEFEYDLLGGHLAHPDQGKGTSLA